MVATDNSYSNAMDDMEEEYESESSDEEEEDVSSSEDEKDPTPKHQGVLEDDDSCPICLNEFEDQQIGVPSSCNHVFCVDCILEWSKSSNSCPVDRTTLESICVYRRFAGRFLRKVAVAKVETPAGEEVDLTYCQVCGSPDNEDTLLLCDGCDQGYHCACLSPPLVEVPHGEWFCNTCQPEPTVQDSSPDHHGLGRTRATERVRAQISQARQRHSRLGGLEQQIDAIVDEILIGAGRRFEVVEQITVDRRRAPPKRPSRKRSRSKPRRRSSSRRRTKSKGKRGKRKKSRCGRKGTEKISKGTRSTTAAAAAFRRPLSVFGDDSLLDEYLARDGEDVPSYLIAQKHRQLAQNALRANSTLPSILSCGDNLISRERLPSPTPNPVPDLLGSILSGQDVLMTPSSNISIDRGGGLRVNKPSCSMSSRPISNTTVKKALTPNKGDDHKQGRRKPNSIKNGGYGRKSAVSPEQNSTGKHKEAAGSSTTNSSSSRSSGSNSRSAAVAGSKPSQGQARGAEDTTANSLGNGGEDFFDVPSDAKPTRKRSPLKRFNLTKQEPDDATNSRAGFKRKIQIKKVFNLPNNPNEPTKSNKEQEAYDPFDPTEDDDDAPDDLPTAAKEEDIYDPFQPTASDDDSQQDEDVGKEEDSPPVFQKFEPNPESPPPASPSPTEDSEASPPSPEPLSGEDKEQPDGKCKVASKKEQDDNQPPEDLTDLDIDEMLDSNFDESTYERTKPKNKAPPEQLSPDIDMFAEPDLSQDSEGAPESSAAGPPDPSAAWREKIRSLSTSQENDDVVKLPGFKAGASAVTPVQFKKLKKLKSTEEIGKAFADTKVKSESSATAKKQGRTEKGNEKSDADLIPKEGKTLKSSASDSKEDVTEKSKDKRQTRKKAQGTSNSSEGEQHPSSSPKKEQHRDLQESGETRQHSRSPSKGRNRTRESQRERKRSRSRSQNRHRSRSKSTGRSRRKNDDTSRDRSGRTRRSRSRDRHAGRRDGATNGSSRRSRSRDRRRRTSRSSSRKKSPRARPRRRSRSRSRRRSSERKRISPESRNRRNAKSETARESSLDRSLSTSRKRSSDRHGRRRSRSRSATKAAKESQRDDDLDEQRHGDRPKQDLSPDLSESKAETTMDESMKHEHHDVSLDGVEVTKVKKHKKKKRLEEGELEVKEEVFSAVDEDEVERSRSSKKKKKKEKYRPEEVVEEVEAAQSDRVRRHMGKRQQEEPEGELIESFSDDTRHRNDEGKRKHRKRPHDVITEHVEQKSTRVVDDDVADFLVMMTKEGRSESEDSQELRKAKKKKHKRSHDASDNSDIEHGQVTTPRSSKKRRHRHVSETLSSDAQVVATERTKSHKKKKSHRYVVPAEDPKDFPLSDPLDLSDEIVQSKHKPKMHKKRKHQSPVPSSDEMEEVSRKSRKKKKKHQKEQDSDDDENIEFTVDVKSKSKKKKKKHDKRRSSQEGSSLDDGSGGIGSQVDVEEEEVYVRSSGDSRDVGTKSEESTERRMKVSSKRYQEDSSSVDAEAEQDALRSRTSKHKKRKKHRQQGRERTPEVRHAELTRMLSSQELDEDQKELISPILTPKRILQTPGSQDAAEANGKEEVDGKHGKRSDGDEIYSPTAALSDESPADLRSPSPITPLSLSPEPQPTPIQTSSQEIKETLAEEFLEQSRKRWNERKRAPPLNTSFNTSASSEIPGIGTEEKSQQREDTLVEEKAESPQPPLTHTDQSDLLKPKGTSLIPAKELPTGSPVNTPLEEDIFADSPVADMDWRQIAGAPSGLANKESRAHEPSLDNGHPEVQDKMPSDEDKALPSAPTTLPVPEDVSAETEATEGEDRNENHTAADRSPEIQQESEKHSPELSAEIKTRESPTSGDRKSEKTDHKQKHDSKRRSYSSERRRSRKDSRSPRRDSKSRRDDEKSRDRRSRGDRSRRRRSRSPKREESRQRSRRSPRRRSRSKSPKRERESRKRVSSPRRRRSRSPNDRSRRQRSRSTSRNRRRTERRHRSPTPPSHPEKTSHSSPVSAFRSAAESVAFTSKKKDNIQEDAGPQPIATISGLAGENGQIPMERHAMQDHHDLADDEFIPQALLMKSKQSSALRTLIEVPTRPTLPDPKPQTTTVETALTPAPTTKPLIILKDNTKTMLASMASPADTVTQTAKKVEQSVAPMERDTPEELVDEPKDSPPPPPPPSGQPKTPPRVTKIPGLSYEDEPKQEEEDSPPTDMKPDVDTGKDASETVSTSAEQSAEQGNSTLNPTQILNIVGLDPQQKSAAQTAIFSLATLSKSLGLGGKERRLSQKEDDGLSPASIDNIESSAVEMYNKGKQTGLLKKFQFQERVVEEAKLAIKHHYERREISKVEYKEIMKRAVNKICSSGTTEVNHIKIRRLIRRYVEKYQQKNAFKKEKMRSKLDGKLERAPADRSPSPPPYQPLTPPGGVEKQDTEGKPPVDTPSLLKREPRKIVTLPDLPLPPPPPPPRPRHMM